MCNHPALSYPYSDNPIDGQLVAQCGKLLVLDRMLVKLHAAGELPPYQQCLPHTMGADVRELSLVVSLQQQSNTSSYPCFTKQSLCAAVCGLCLPAYHACIAHSHQARFPHSPDGACAGHRVLLFATMTKLLDLLQVYLAWRRVPDGHGGETPLHHLRIDGGTALEARWLS